MVILSPAKLTKQINHYKFHAMSTGNPNTSLKSTTFYPSVGSWPSCNSQYISLPSGAHGICHFIKNIQEPEVKIGKDTTDSLKENPSRGVYNSQCVYANHMGTQVQKRNTTKIPDQVQSTDNACHQYPTLNNWWVIPLSKISGW